ncbi:MAG TPA: sigma-54 dependent transcriptional regulator [Planctomycetota bacterium]|nr:sigma-54 dependent transcriptional regulator [Planctomycetota bacterium]
MPDIAQPTPGRILVVDDEVSMRKVLSAVLGSDGHEVRATDDGNEAIAAFADGSWDLVIEDLRMPKMHGLELLGRLKGIDPAAMVIVMTAFGTWDTAVEAMRLGAYDYLKKPCDNEHLRAVVAKAIARRRAGATSARFRANTSPAVEVLIGNDPRMREVMDVIRRVAPTDSTVLIQGESGTGKELAAASIHSQSLRADGPFIDINCGAFAETLLDSELFGHIKGAFTGAVADKMGLMEAADQGTLFLDEVAELSPATQVKLLRVLETRQFRPVGGVNDKRVDVRFIAATNRNLAELVTSGAFREDLFFRLNVIPLVIPPLRDRRGDIPQLAGFFLAKHAARTGRQITTIDEGAAEWLKCHDWPGNVRELENTIERAVALTRSDRLTVEDLAATSNPLRAAPASAPTASQTRTDPIATPPAGMNLDEHLAAIEKDFILKALASTGGNMTEAAKLLGMTFRAIRYKVRKYGLR